MFAYFILVGVTDVVQVLFRYPQADVSFERISFTRNSCNGDSSRRSFDRDKENDADVYT